MITKAEIQLVRSLADKRNRDREGLFAAEGEKLVGELRASHLRVRKIYALDGILPGPETTTVSEKEMERLSLLKTPNRALALVETPRHRLSAADWFGIRDVVCSTDSADCFNPKVVQATMGAILRVRVHYVDLERFLSDARSSGIPVYGTFLEGENLYDTPLTPTGILLMGNEGRGVSEACARHVNRKLFIPPYPADRRATESLNVAMATGIACAEFRRRNR